MTDYTYKCSSCQRIERRTQQFMEDWVCPCGFTNKLYIPVELKTRVFETGATRDTDTTKLDYEGFLSPLVLTRFAEYMHKCRLRNIPPGETMRASDNWQKGIPLDAYMKSGFRHFMDWWMGHRWDQVDEEALCALFFNVQGYLHEMIKARLCQTK